MCLLSERGAVCGELGEAAARGVHLRGKDHQNGADKRGNQFDAEQAEAEIANPDRMEQNPSNKAADESGEHRADPAAGQSPRHDHVRGPTHKSSDQQRQQQSEGETNGGQHQPAKEDYQDQ